MIAKIGSTIATINNFMKKNAVANISLKRDLLFIVKPLL